MASGPITSWEIDEEIAECQGLSPHSVSGGRGIASKRTEASRHLDSESQEKNETRTVSNTTHKNKLKMD